MNDENRIDLSIEMYEDLKETLVKAIKNAKAGDAGNAGLDNVQLERIERLTEAAERSQGQVAQMLEQLQRHTALPGVKTEQMQEFTDKYNALLAQLAGRLGTINHENQHTHTLIEQVGQAVEALKRTDALPVQEHRHTYTLDLKSSKTFLTMFAMLGGIFLQAAFIYRISENNRLLAANDLKYRYVKMCGKIGEKELMELETVFWDEQYRNLRDTVRNQVERYEEAVRRRAEQLERATVKERKAKKLLDDAKNLGFSREVATWKKYCCVCKRVREFLAHTYHREDIPLKELNLTFINDFEYFLRTEKKCRTNTVWGYMIVLKHIVAIARNDGRLPFNPFSGYINSPESVDRGYLSQEEIKAVMNYKTVNKAHARIRDLFVFSIFTGLAYADVKGLTTDNLQTMFDGNLWIITRRKKTNTESRIRLLDIPKRIIEKYADQRLDNHVFYMPCNCHCNDILREIGKQCGIKNKLTFHCLRHTYAMEITLSHGVPMETVSRMLGHSRVDTTQIYAQVTDNKIDTDTQSLDKRIAERFTIAI